MLKTHISWHIHFAKITMISIKKLNRDQALDLIRGIAIIMMILFHLIYDLNEFGYTKQVIRLAKYFAQVRRLIYY